MKAFKYFTELRKEERPIKTQLTTPPSSKFQSPQLTFSPPTARRDYPMEGALRKPTVRVRSGGSTILPIDALGSNSFSLLAACVRSPRRRRAAILKPGSVERWDGWRRRRWWLVRLVSTRVILSKFASLRAPAFSVAPIPRGLLSLSPVILSSCL